MEKTILKLAVVGAGTMGAAIAACGALFSAESVWILSDIFNGLMAFVNISGIIIIIIFNKCNVKCFNFVRNVN